VDFEQYRNELKSVLERCNREDWESAAKELHDIWSNSGTVYVIGNGGSAATASHFETDWGKGLNSNLGSNYRVISLTSNLSMITAIGNDLGFEEIFSFQVKTKCNSTDCLLSISGSGNSINIIQAIDTAIEKGMKTISLTGFSGGEVRQRSRHNVHVDSNNMQIVEDIHSMFGHFVLRYLGNVI
jgi:D-sedoheptulose 7-phosphate isomerase